jgi:imidazolonepropionase
MIWDSLYINAKIATCDESTQGFGFIEQGAMGVKNKKISFVGKQCELDGKLTELAHDIIDVNGRLITAGLIDCHTHLVYAGDRSYDFHQRLHGASYAEIARSGGGILSTVNATTLADESSLYQQSARRLESLMAQGVTTVEIKSGYGLIPEVELKQLRVISKLAKNYPISIYPTFLAAHALPITYQGKADEYIDMICQVALPQVAKAQLARAIDAFCESIAFTPAQITRLFECAKNYGFDIKLHAEQLSHTGGTNLAARFNAISADHLEFAREQDIQAMKAAKTTAVLLPAAFYFLREQQAPPIDLFRQYDVPMALATDCNPGTAPTTSLPLMMNMACVFWRLTPEEALRGVTIHAAKALGISEEYGSLRVNKFADFIIWPLEKPEELVYLINTPRPDMIIKHGSPLPNMTI